MTKRRWGKWIFLLGLSLAAAGLLYEGMHYPWGALLGRQAVPDDPAPVSDTWVETSAPEQPLTVLPGEEAENEPAADAEPMQAGIIKIPRLQAADNIVEGVDQPALRLGVGHMGGTALPGQTGNCVLAGHRPRDLLRHLDLVETGDTILLSDQENRYTYEVFRTMTVEPTEFWITEPVEGRDAVVTLFTCTPYMVSTHRLVVQAELTETAPLS